MLTVWAVAIIGCSKPDDDDWGDGGGNGGVDTPYEYVDLGLPSGTLWATCNVGALSPEDYGDRFAWGETEPKEVYNWNSYKFGKKDMLTKYCYESSHGYNGFADNKRVLELDDDVAAVRWGRGWCIPDTAQWVELYQNTTSDWTTINGVSGRLYTGSNGNSIFMPAAGDSFEGEPDNQGVVGYYWTRNLSDIVSAGAFFYMVDKYWIDEISHLGRAIGISVRPVLGTGNPDIPDNPSNPTDIHVITYTPYDITQTSAVCGGGVASESGTSIIERGICYGIIHNPNINGLHKVASTSGLGEYTCNITGLESATTYYVRAYAMNNNGIYYGEEKSFCTAIGGGGGNGDVPIGAINGIFSVSETEKVYFSKGNLQYQASTNTWKFAENQWDVIGDENINISSTYSGWIDLFGWGTSGWNCGNSYYRPWDSDNSDGSLYGPSGQYNLTGSYANSDWGNYNAISNGGNQAGGWRMLTGGSNGEWYYVFNTRSTSSGIRYAKAEVEGVNGVILLPDDWNSSYYSLSNTNSSGASFSNNVITSSNWTNSFQSHGAVFLPSAGYRIGASIISGAGLSGNYWSASCNVQYHAYGVYFNDLYICSNDYSYRYFGSSVRLVCPVMR